MPRSISSTTTLWRSVSDSPAHLVDLLPTLAEIGGTSIPENFPNRKPTPLAGTSLTPVFAGKPIASRPPIHLLYGVDRGLRDGEWKIASYRSQAWELYHIATDRTELNNLAQKHPERVAEMVAKWNEIAAQTMELKPEPVSPETAHPKHREYSNYSGEHGADTGSFKGGKGKKK